MSETYAPEPIDTSDVELPAEIADLASKLAVHVHDVWARQRIEDGWSHGARRDDESREHPSLIPYEQLPESEQTYDQVVVSEVLKAALALGYRIEAPRD